MQISSRRDRIEKNRFGETGYSAYVGSNRIPPPEKKGWFDLICDNFRNPAIVVFIVATFFWFVVNMSMNLPPWEPLAFLIAIIITVLVSWCMDNYTENSIDLYQSDGGDEPTLLVRNGNVISVPKKEVYKRDYIVLNPGYEVPADILLTEVENLVVSEKVITGSSEPVEKQVCLDHDISDKDLTNRNDIALRGSVVISGYGKGYVRAVGYNTVLGKLEREQRAISDPETELSKNLSSLEKRINESSILLAVALFSFLNLSYFFLKEPTNDSIYDILALEIKFLTLTAAVFVAGVPRHLTKSLNFAIALSMKVARKIGLGINCKKAVELSNVDVIFTDLSGLKTEVETLTDGTSLKYSGSDLPEYIERARRNLGVNIVLLTSHGDVEEVIKLSKEAGIIEYAEEHLVCNASVVEAVDLNKGCPKVIVCTDPDDKIKVLRRFQESGKRCAVIGDSEDETYYLKAADVSLALSDNKEYSKDCSDIALSEEGSLISVIKGIKWARSIYRNLQRTLVFQLSVIIAFGLSSLIGPLFGLDRPFSILQILYINIIAGPIAIFTLLLEPGDKGLDKSPVGENGRLVTGDMIRYILTRGGILFAVIMSLILTNVTEYIFPVFLTYLSLALIDARDFERIEGKSILSSKTFYAAIILYFVNLALVQNGQTFFKTEPLTLIQWVAVTGIAQATLLLSMISHSFVRK